MRVLHAVQPLAAGRARRGRGLRRGAEPPVCATAATRSASSPSAWTATAWWPRCRRGPTASTSSPHNRHGSAPPSMPPTSPTCGRWRTVLDAVDRFRPDVVHSHSIQGMSALPLRDLVAPRPVAHVHTIHDYWLVCQRASMTNRDGRSCADAVPAVRRRHRRPPARARTATDRRWCCASPRRRPASTTASRRSTTASACCASPTAARARATAAPVGADARVRLPRSAGAAQGRAHAHRGLRAPARGLRPACASPVVARWRTPWRRGPAATSSTSASSTPRPRRRSLHSLDCLVVPSEWREPGALVVSEAKAELLPVIGARIGGIPEVVPPSCAELLFTPGDAADLARVARRRSAPTRSASPSRRAPAAAGTPTWTPWRTPTATR